ncbi:hypothetical protein ACWCPF_06630 [Streptomyces sp. NPDC001858]
MPDVTPRTSPNTDTSTDTSTGARTSANTGTSPDHGRKDRPPAPPEPRKDTRTVPAERGGPLLPDDEGKRIALRMRHAVVGFVDGPRDAVAEADQALEELAARLTEAMDRRRRTLRRSWQPTDGAEDRSATTAPAVDTEQLRLALRDYRELTERLLRL